MSKRDITFSGTTLKSSLAPIEIAIDAVAVFAAMLGCVLLVWLPFILAWVFLRLARTGRSIGLLALLVLIEMVCAVLGLLLIWLARGLLQRILFRTGFSVFLFAIWGLFLAYAPSLQRKQSSLQHFQSYVEGIGLLLAAVISAFGLKRYNGSLNE